MVVLYGSELSIVFEFLEKTEKVECAAPNAFFSITGGHKVAYIMQVVGNMAANS